MCWVTYTGPSARGEYPPMWEGLNYLFQYRSNSLEMLTFEREIIEHESTCKVTEFKYLKVPVVFHADWSYDECPNDIERRFCGHTAIQHPRCMTEKPSSGGSSSRHWSYFLVQWLAPPICNAFIAIGTVSGAFWLKTLLIQLQRSAQNKVYQWWS